MCLLPSRQPKISEVSRLDVILADSLVYRLRIGGGEGERSNPSSVRRTRASR
jgi:hypothetical protein